MDILNKVDIYSFFSLLKLEQSVFKGFSKFDCFGKHGVVPVNANDYSKTPVGLGLRKKIEEFHSLLLDPSSSSTSDSLRVIEESTENSSGLESEASPLVKNSDRDELGVGEVDENPSRHTLSPIEGPAVGDEFASRQRSKLEPIAPFVDDPQDAILKLNQKTNSIPYGDVIITRPLLHREVIAEDYDCPYHDKVSYSSDIDLPSTITLPSSGNFPSEDSKPLSCGQMSLSTKAQSDCAAGDSGFDSTQL